MMLDRLVAGLVAGAFLVQAPESPYEYVAFRLDRERAVAVLKALSNAPPYRGAEPTERVNARYGFAPFEPPDAWKKWMASAPSAGDRWRLHLAPGQAVNAVVERIVGGQPQCEGMLGAILRVPLDGVDTYNATKARYFIARQTVADSSPASSATFGIVADAVVAADGRGALERLLAGVLEREHPKIKAESDAYFARVAPYAVTSQRNAARRWREFDAALQRGTAKLTYDLQTFRLRAEGPPVHFVRAEWLVARRQAFAVAVWIRGGNAPEIVEVNVKPASWLRMGEFNGQIFRGNLGLVLNVLDRDGDGWGEILFAQDGYEGFSITLQEYSPSGFSPQHVGYGTGC